MQKSKIVEVDGIFIGAVVLLSDSEGWRFVAADHRADEANGRTAPTLYEAQLLAKKAFFSSRNPGGAFRPGAAPQPAAANAWPEQDFRASA